ncbi:MAG: UbiA family prenyltransferase [Candidatus Diapherotrites archaeon]
MRPLEWSKSFGNMVIAVIVVAYTFNLTLDLQLFLLGFVGVAVLWSGLYTLNDYTDWEKDSKHDVKKYRPIPSGKVLPEIALMFAILLIGISFGIGIFIMQITMNFLYLYCLIAMLVNQILYTTKPFNFKKRPILDLISGSMVNPIFRFYAGWVLFVAAFNAPILIILFVVGLQFGGYTLYKIGSKKHEAESGYRNSAVLFGERNLRILTYIVMGLGGLSFVFLTLNSKLKTFFPALESLGELPLRFAWLVILSLLATPLYWTSLKKPQGMNMKKMYRLVYVHYLLFILGFIIIFLLSP